MLRSLNGLKKRERKKAPRTNCVFFIYLFFFIFMGVLPTFECLLRFFIKNVTDTVHLQPVAAVCIYKKEWVTHRV